MITLMLGVGISRASYQRESISARLPVPRTRNVLLSPWTREPLDAGSNTQDTDLHGSMVTTLFCILHTILSITPQIYLPSIKYQFTGRVMTGFMTCYKGGGPSPTLGGGNFELLSHKKKTKQSSTGWGGVPSRAVDGNPDGVYGRKSVSHSRKKRNNWWLVDLGEKKHINLVLVYNRADRCCAKRISGTKVWI